MIKLSKVGKLDGIRSWSLEAGKTCPFSYDSQGKKYPSCQGCYATGGNYRFPNVKAPREHNRVDWRRDGWVDDMIKELDNDRYFRWFDSGDMYHPELAQKIFKVMKATPWVKHWMPTMSWRNTRFKSVLESMESLDNVVIRKSSGFINKELDITGNSSTISSIDSQVTCRAYETGGKCKGCRKCWDKEIKQIVYIAHGVKMKKVVKFINKG